MAFDKTRQQKLIVTVPHAVPSRLLDGRMPKCEDLLNKAHNNPKGLRFEELQALAICNGWALARSEGSHFIYKKSGKCLMNFQKDNNGMAKSYQVKQLLATINNDNQEEQDVE